MRLCFNLNFRAGTLADLFETSAHERLAASLAQLPEFSGLTTKSDGFSILLFDGPTPDRSSRLGEIYIAFDRIDWVFPLTEFHWQELDKTLWHVAQVAVKEGIQLGFWSGLLVLDSPFERPKPQRDLGRIRQDAILDVFDPTSPDCPPEWPSLLQGIERSLPPGISRSSVGHYIVLNWIGADFSEAQLLASMLTRIRWFYDQGNFPLLGDFNQHGDELIPLVNVKADPFYTFYQEFDAAAFKALASLEDPLAEASLARIVSDLEIGATRESRHLSRVFLILPTRDLANAGQAKFAAGSKIFTAYPDSDGQLWLCTTRPPD